MIIKELLAKKGSDVLTSDGNVTVLEAAKLMNGKRVGSVVVVDENTIPVGILTERDVLKLVAEDITQISNLKLSEVMTTDLIIATPEDDTEAVQNIMTEKHLRHLPVMDDRKIVGLISIGDIVKVTLTHCKFEVHHMRDYIMGKI